MAISRKIDRKAPSQAPKDFFACKQTGGSMGGSGMPPEKPQSGAMREKVYGKKALG